MRELFERFRPDAVMHLAAESHVDRSIDGPGDFIQTNVVGTFTLLEAALGYWRGLPGAAQDASASTTSRPTRCTARSATTACSTKTTAYDPNSPYSATKAASDHLVRAWHHTYGLPVVVTNCSNNYGPYQFPEKLIPLMILNALEGKPLPVYGTGDNVRDWLYVEDHARALLAGGRRTGRLGETYNIGGAQRADQHRGGRGDLRAARRARADADDRPAQSLITFVADRPGHDLRYAIDAAKIETRARLAAAARRFETGLRKTVRWYLDNRDWWERIRSGGYRGERLGESYA